MDYLSLTLSDDISGAAWIIEHDRQARGLKPLSRASLAYVAKSRIRRADRIGAESRESTPADTDGNPLAELAIDHSADSRDSIATQAAAREELAGCLAYCRRIDSRATDGLLAALADGICLPGQRRSALPIGSAAESAGVSFQKMRYVVDSMRAGVSR